MEGENEQDDYQLKGSDASVDRSIFPDGSGDWMYETGRGFYEQSDLVGRILGQLLMQRGYGLSKIDLPDGRTIGLTPTSTGPSSICTPKVGARYFMKTNHEVYTHEK